MGDQTAKNQQQKNPRIPRIGHVTCSRRQPFDMKKEKNTVFVFIIALL